MSVFRKTISVILSLAIAIGIVTSSVFSEKCLALESTGNYTFDCFITDERFTAGAKWPNNPDDNPDTLLSQYRSWTCCAYCADFVKYCYGYDSLESGSYFNNINNIQAGDVVHVYYYDNYNRYNEHYFAVLKRSGNNLYTAEGNALLDSKTGFRGVRIGWNYSISNNNIIGVEAVWNLSEGYHYGMPQPINRPPIGVIEKCEIVNNNQLHIKGWAYDPEESSKSIAVHIYVNDICCTGIPASDSSKDVNDHYGISGNHRFDTYIDLYVYGTVKINFYAIDTQNGSNPPLGEKAYIPKDFYVTSTKPSLSYATIDAIPDQSYSGQNVCPSIKVDYGYRSLTEGKHYTVSYSNNINTGLATVTITGIGEYTGTQTTTFNIVSEEYNVGIESNEYGDISVSKISAYPGDEITIIATPKSGYILDSILIDNVAINGNKFIMPSKNVSVSAVFVPSLSIEEQPSDYNGFVGDTAALKVEATGVNLIYQWQVYKNGIWKNTSLTGNKSATLKVGVTEARDGMKFRCVVSDDTGNSVISDEATIIVNYFDITTQPADYSGRVGETAIFTVDVLGEEITYQWQVYKNGVWKNTSLTGNKTANLEAGIIESRNGMKFRCIVTSASGKALISDTATLTIAAPVVEIISQPEDYEGAIGDNAIFAVVSEGKDLTYQWQVYKNGAWKNTSLAGNKTSDLEVPILESRDGMQFRCVVKDGTGNKAISDVATLIISTVQSSITITKQPESTEKAEGDTVIFNIEAEGEDLTYQWQVYKNGAWKNTSIAGNQSSELPVAVTESRNGMTFRCVVTDANGFTETSDEVTITVK